MKNAKTLTRVIAAVMALALCLCLLPAMTFAEDAPETATLVTDVADLKAGDKVVIVAKEHDYALGSDNAGKYRNRVAVTFNADRTVVNIAAGVSVLAVENGIVEKTFALKDGGKYLCASTTKNQIKLSDTVVKAASWQIEITDGNAKIVAQDGNADSRTLQYNNNTNQERFSCYANTMLPVCIYKVDVKEEPDVTDPSLPPVTTEPSVPTTPVDPDPEMVTVYAKVPADWTEVNLYAWDADNQPMEAWPGSAMTASSENEGWYELEIPETMVKIIINNGNNKPQTVDLTLADGNWIVVKDEQVDGKHTASQTAAKPADPVDPPVDPDPKFDTIADALAGAKDDEFTVRGTVTMLGGKTVFIMDETGGIALYMDKVIDSLKLGDVITGSGAKTVFNGLPELTGVVADDCTVEEGTVPTPKAVTGALTEADICTYVKFTGLEVVSVATAYGNKVNMNLKDAAGNTYYLYSAPLEDVGDIKAYDVIDLTCAVGHNKNGFELRTSLPSEIVKTGSVTPPVTEPDEPDENAIDFSEIKAGDIIVVVMTFNGEKYILPTGVNPDDLNPAEVAKGNPLMIPFVNLESLNKDNHGWIVNKSGNAYTFQTSQGKYLQAIPKNGLSAAGTAADAGINWSYVEVDGVGYLKANDGVDDRYLGSNSTTDFRAYTLQGDALKSNCLNRTLTFYKIGEAEPTDPDVTDPTEKPDVTDPTEPGKTETELKPIAKPELNTDLKLGLVQENLNKTLYFTGEMNGFYLATTENPDEAVDLRLETVEGGYRLYFMDGNTKKYIDIVHAMGTDGKEHDNVIITAEPTAVFVWNDEFKTLVAHVGENDLYLGTYNNYFTISPSKLDKAATSFVAHLYAKVEVPSGGGDNPSVTGDTAMVGMTVAVMLLAVAGIVAIVSQRKKWTR